MIKAPEPNTSRVAIRAVVEAIAQITPITAGLARLYQFTHPSALEEEVQAWQREVSDALNDHEAAIGKLIERMIPRMQIGETALTIALWLAEQSPDGPDDLVEGEKLIEKFSQISKSELEEACFELDHLELVSCSSAIGLPVSHVRIDYSLFWTFDPVVMQTNPLTDAVEIARLMLEDENYGSVLKLHEDLGWPKRRLNPAVAMLIPLFPEGRVRSVIQPNYPTMGFAIMSEDRFQLKNFIREACG